MGRVYFASVSEVAVSAIQDFFEINAPATAIVVVHSVFIGQRSDFGDAAAEMLPITISRASTSGSGGSTPTARPALVGTAAFSGTVEANNTTVAGTKTLLQSYTWNIQAGFYYNPTPEERIIIPPSGRLTVGLPVAPADALTCSGTLVFEAIG